MSDDDLHERPASPTTEDAHRGLRLDILLWVALIVGTAALVSMRIFSFGPHAVEQREGEETRQREREDKLRKDLIQLQEDARAGKAGKAIQYLFTGDESLLEDAKREAARQQPAVKEPGDPQPSRQP